MTDKILSMICLCQKAGFLSSGEESCEKSIRSGKAKLIIISEDASENTKKKFRNSSAYYKIPIYFFSTKQKLGSITGKRIRAVLTVNNINFKKNIENLFWQMAENSK